MCRVFGQWVRILAVHPLPVKPEEETLVPSKPGNVAQLRLAKEKSEAELTVEAASLGLQLSESKRECDLLKRALSQMKARSKKMEQLQVCHAF